MFENSTTLWIIVAFVVGFFFLVFFTGGACLLGWWMSKNGKNAVEKELRVAVEGKQLARAEQIAATAEPLRGMAPRMQRLTLEGMALDYMERKDDARKVDKQHARVKTFLENFDKLMPVE